MLSGLTVVELLALRVSHVDERAQTLTVPGSPSRVLALEGPLQTLTRLCTSRTYASTLFVDAMGEPLTAQDIEAAVSTSALDANLDEALQVTPETLRHTMQGPVQALAFTLSRQSPSHTGELHEDEYRRIFLQASGRYGTTRDYAQATFDELRRQGIHDRALARLLALSFPKS